MSAIRKAPIQLTILTLFLLAVVLVLAFRYTARGQDNGAPTLSDQDIGVAFSSGGAQAGQSGECTITSAGTNISGQTDSFNYLYESLGTNGQIVAQLLGIQTSGGTAEAGLMIRESLDAASRNAAILASGSGACLFQCRTETNATTRQTLGSTNVGVPCWMKLVRNGDWIGGYTSTDGTNWVLVDWRMINKLAPDAYVGLAVTAGNNQGSSASAQFGELSAGTADFSQITLPVVGNGDGLLGSYYDNRDLFGHPVTNRVDSQVDFDFFKMLSQYPASMTSTDKCVAEVGVPRLHEFGVCWFGEVEAQFTEPYTFYTRSDDGVRVWLNEHLIIDDWHCHVPANVVASSPINLTAGQRYLLRVEYFQNLGGAQVHLGWSSPSTSPRLMPQSQLYSEPTMDANGFPIYWEEHYFGQTNIDPNADPDGDGLSNMQEYQLHTDPTNSQTFGVPDMWGNGDIGDWNSVGSANYSNSVFTAGSAGGDIWGGADSFHYVFQPLGTNGQIVARVLSIQGTNQYAKAGLMVRETLEQSARNAMVTMSSMGRLAFQWREAAGMNTQQPRFGHASGPYWLKLVRCANDQFMRLI